MSIKRFFNPDWLAVHELTLAGSPPASLNRSWPRAETGTVVQIDRQLHALTLSRRLIHSQHVWHWDQSTRVLRANQAISIGALKEGDRVKTWGEKRNRSRVAREVRILSASL
jgi:hypothetical protein